MKPQYLAGDVALRLERLPDKDFYEEVKSSKSCVVKFTEGSNVPAISAKDMTLPSDEYVYVIGKFAKSLHYGLKVAWSRIEIDTEQNSEALVSDMIHVQMVKHFASGMANTVINRSERHDESKFSSPEREIFEEFTPKLKSISYGSDEYKKALEHHYVNNPHHPEHYANGVAGMQLCDLVEMACDWWASIMQNNGSIEKTMEINTKRFNLSPDLASIIENTLRYLEEKTQGLPFLPFVNR